MVNGIPGYYLGKWEKERLEKIAHARQMIMEYSANGDAAALAWWEKALERLEKQSFGG